MGASSLLTKENDSPDIIINGILCYISTARHVIKHDDIIRACLVFYESTDVLSAKDMLYDIAGEKSKRRRTEYRIMHELEDILLLLKKCDEGGIKLPRFVADTYNSMPPTSGFEVVAQSMQSLIHEISNLRSEVEILKENRSSDELRAQESTLMQEDLLIIKGELRKLNSKIVGNELRRESPGVMVNSLDESISKSHQRISCQATGTFCQQTSNASCSMDSVSPSAPPASQESWHLLHRLTNDPGGTPSAPTYAGILAAGRNQESNFLVASPKSPMPLTRDSHKDQCVSSKIGLSECASTMNIPVSLSEPNVSDRPTWKSIPHTSSEELENDDDAQILRPTNTDDDGFRVWHNRKNKKKNIVGVRKPASDAIRGAVRVADIFVGNCDPSVTVDSLRKYLKEEMNIEITKGDQLVSNSDYASFKLTLKLDDRSKLLSPDMWPEGVICRKFYNRRYRQS